MSSEPEETKTPKIAPVELTPQIKRLMEQLVYELRGIKSATESDKDFKIPFAEINNPRRKQRGIYGASG